MHLEATLSGEDNRDILLEAVTSAGPLDRELFLPKDARQLLRATKEAVRHSDGQPKADNIFDFLFRFPRPLGDSTFVENDAV